MNPLISKLEHFIRLSAEDRAVLQRFAAQSVRTVPARTDISQEGDKPKDVHLIVEGWAYRYKELEDGRRQILSLFLPGDICDQNVFILREMDHSIGTITAARVAELPRAFFDEISAGYPRITAALRWETLVNAAIEREWTMNLGQRNAIERMAHLLCELFVRLEMTGLTIDNTCAFPLTQADLAEATGLSTVHVNRTLQQLRAHDLIALRCKTLVVPDLDRLMRTGLFNPNYLHRERDGRQHDASE